MYRRHRNCELATAPRHEAASQTSQIGLDAEEGKSRQRHCPNETVRGAEADVSAANDADSPPSAAELGYPPDIVAMMAVTGGLNPHTFDADGPVFGESEGRRMLPNASAGDLVDVFWGDHWESAVLVEIGSSGYKLKREGASAEDWVRPFLVRRPQTPAATSSQRSRAR